jgi:exodeoxyribonuclease-5
VTWSPQQEAAIKDVRRWMGERGSQVFRLFGYAGTGKTTLARELAGAVDGRVLFGAFTGKAALVLRRKGCEDASTIHSMIYRLDEENDGWQPKFLLNHDSEVRDAKLVIIDECSMVDEELGRDLLSFGTKVLVLGDPAQLPPVKGAGFFTNATPDVMLTEVHRQARDNPIIAMSMTIREGGSLVPGMYGTSAVIPRADVKAEHILAASQIIVGLNRTRQAYNRRIRTLLGRQGDMPVVDDKLVCLRNDREKRLLNGGLWTVARTKKKRKKAAPTDTVSLEIVPDDAESWTATTAVKVRREFFEGTDDELAWEDRKGTQEFTYGYALTCHKSQGSQWPDVIVFDEAGAFRENATRWRYTAITRAAERVTVVQ